MKNKEIAKILDEIGDYLDAEKVSFKPFAYHRAALALQALEEDIEGIYKTGGLKALEEISGIGKSIAEKIEEYLKTGKIEYYEEFKKKLPVDIEEIIHVEGMGPRKARMLYEKLGIKNLSELEIAAREGKIRSLPGFGEQSEKNILEGIEFLKREKGRFLLGDIFPIVREVYEKLKELKEVEKIDIVGSTRRMKETIGDADFLVISKKPEPIMDFFTSLPGVVKIWGKGATKASVRMKEGFDMDIRIVPEISYGAALQYFTGSKEHNIHLRKIAIDQGLKLNEYGLFRGKRIVAGKKEEDVYKTLGLEWIPPELRENNGEIETALLRRPADQAKLDGLPKIIGYKDIKGDLHCHSSWARGANSIQEIVNSAIAMGYEYIGISDHTEFLKIEKGLSGKQLLEQRKEIQKINADFEKKGMKFRVLQGCETNILTDGSLDISDAILSQLDYVIAGVHSQFKLTKEQMTERIIRAIKNPHIDIISHPTGRLILKRDEYQIDFDKILRAAKETGTILEINAYPDRLDLKDINIRKAKESGVKMIINTDSHSTATLGFMEYGIAQARRGWAEKENIINTYSLEKLMEFFR